MNHSRRVVRIMALTVLAGWAGVSRVAAQISIQPAFVELNLDTGRPSGRFLISNVSDTKQRYRIQARFFNYTPDGAIVFPGENDPRSLASRIKFNPTEFVVPAKTTRAVRFVILQRGAVAPGEYWAAMSLNQLTVRATEHNIGQERSINLKVTTSLLVPIFGHAGQITYNAELTDLKIVATPKGPFVCTEIHNTGTGRVVVKGTFTVKDKSAMKVADGDIGHTYVMAGAVRRFTAPIDPVPPTGRYTVEVSYKTDRLEQPLKRRLTFDWTAPPPPPPDAPTTDKSADPATPPTTPDASNAPAPPSDSSDLHQADSHVPAADSHTDPAPAGHAAS